MRAIVVQGEGREARLVLGEVRDPRPAAGEVLLDVAATAVNRADLLQARGLYPPPPGASTVIGLEASGTIAALGSGVKGWRVGEMVMALLPGGGYAERAVAPAGSVMLLPPGIDRIAAASVPEVFLTAFLNLFELGRATEARWVLVHGGSGGVGTAAIQMLKAEGKRVLVTAGSPGRCRRCLELGADEAIDYHAGPFAPRVMDLTGGEGVDLILDAIGAPYLAPNLSCLRTGGRLVIIGLMGGRKAEIDLSVLLTRRIQVIGSTLRSRQAAEKAALVSRFLARFWERLADGSMRPVVDRVLPLDRAEEAHRLLERGEIFGKLVLEV
jgi:putative PIG3 family NAD(P)H quinone oxidoreductase